MLGDPRRPIQGDSPRPSVQVEWMLRHFPRYLPAGMLATPLSDARRHGAMVHAELGVWSLLTR